MLGGMSDRLAAALAEIVGPAHVLTDPDVVGRLHRRLDPTVARAGRAGGPARVDGRGGRGRAGVPGGRGAWSPRAATPAWSAAGSLARSPAVRVGRRCRR